MLKYLIFDLDGTLIESNKSGFKNAIKLVKEYDEEYLDKAKYIFESTPGMALIEQLEKIFEDKKPVGNDLKSFQDELIQLKKDIYKRIRKKEGKVDFFKGAKKKIKELSKDYTLFLTTGNSTKFAKEVLERGGIKDCFELIYGSTHIMKGMDHLNLFKEHVGDDDFFKKSLYTGDGEQDRIYAKQAGIIFCHIKNDFSKSSKCKHKVDSVVDIDKVIDKLK